MQTASSSSTSSVPGEFDKRRALSLPLLTSKIFPRTHWVTPRQEKYRYDTYFFVAPLSDPSSLPTKVKQDGWHLFLSFFHDRYTTLIHTYPEFIINSSFFLMDLADSETVAVDWLSPQEALQRFREGTIKLPPPTYLILSDLCAYPRLTQLVHEADQGRDLR
jgi:hypothetical protein